MARPPAGACLVPLGLVMGLGEARRGLEGPGAKEGRYNFLSMIFSASIPRLIEEPGQISCVLQLGGFSLVSSAKKIARR
jgi:hypothetical protein